MALTLENINLVKQRTRWETRKPGAMAALKALWRHLEQIGNPDLQFKVLDHTTQADVVIADAPCKLYALYLKKPAASVVAAWVKLSDGTSVAASGDLVVSFVAPVGALKELCIVYPDGLPFATACEAASHTAVNGATDSEIVDSCSGFAIIGAP